MITIAAIAPHAPILLPDVGSVKDRTEVKKTIKALEKLGKKFKEANADEVIISSPHEDWGFNVPLFFLAPNFKGEIKKILTDFRLPQEHFTLGENLAKKLDKNKNYALIASGDLSHVLKEDGPYGLHPDGPKFDKELIKLLVEKNIPELLKLDDKYKEASDCGLRSFAFALGLLEGSREDLNPNILSYEGPFGVGYLVAQLA